MEALLNTSLHIQPYATVLIVDRPTLKITAVCGDNEDVAAAELGDLIGTQLDEHLAADTIARIRQSATQVEPGVVRPEDRDRIVTDNHQIVVHHFAEELVLELEPCRNWPHPDDYSTRLNSFTRELEDAPTINALMQCLTDGLLYHFGYDRVIVLQFDQQFNGLVTHESATEGTPSLLNVHFTKEDVPPGARYNQLINSVYNFADVNADMREVTGSYGPAAREILRRHVACRAPQVNYVPFLRDNDLSCIGYLSLISGGELFGSLYMHGKKPVHLDYQMRAFLMVAGRVAQQKLAYHIYSRTLRLRQAANVVRDRLQEHIVNSENLNEGLVGGSTTIVDLLEDTHGVAICSDEQLLLHGTTPDRADVEAIIGWMKQEHGDEDLYCTDQLTMLFPPARQYREKAAGILFLPLDVEANQWIVWFRPEVVQTVTYGSMASDVEEESRRRFYVHDDTRHGYSLPWTTDDVGTAYALQAFIQDVVMQRYARAKRSTELLREAYEDLETFSYTIGHDLRAPLRGISSFAEILEEDFGQALGAEGRGHLRVIQENADRMRRFMTDLLALSRVDRSSMIVNELSVAELVERVLKDRATSERQSFECVVQEDLPPIYGDYSQLVTVFTNLLANAIKYSSQAAHPRIEVGFTGEYRSGHPVFCVSDNGIGIPSDQHQRIFDLFTRSTNVGDLQGTGIGLALVQRIINFHDGEVWIESEVGRGAKFFFYTGAAS